MSSIGLGCMGMSHAYGTASTEKEAKELIEKAIDLGCTFFDTAEIYGTAEDPHHNEKLLGEVLKPYRNKIVLASKCGIRFDESATTVNKPLIPDGRPETIKAFAKDKNATPAQISLAWMSAKKPYSVPIPGTRKLDRLEENMRASEVHLTDGEVRKIDEMLDQIPMSQVFGGSKIKN